MCVIFKNNIIQTVHVDICLIWPLVSKEKYIVSLCVLSVKKETKQIFILLLVAFYYLLVALFFSALYSTLPLCLELFCLPCGKYDH